MARIIDGEKKNIVGVKVRQLREAAGMSQQELANKLETMAVYICRGSISRIEDQSRTCTDIELLGFSKLFDIPISDFFIENE